jgi:hypothetical protein
MTRLAVAKSFTPPSEVVRDTKKMSKSQERRPG